LLISSKPILVSLQRSPHIYPIAPHTAFSIWRGPIKGTATVTNRAFFIEKALSSTNKAELKSLLGARTHGSSIDPSTPKQRLSTLFSLSYWGPLQRS
jgi:hypothetical protein